MSRSVGFLWFFFTCASAHSFTDEANARLPRLFHLDDYDRCLSQKDGLYCLGILELSPIHPSPVYQHIKAYTSPFTFNRTRLHRGYCVSERCPSRERNATLRFERCVSERARRHALSARLHTLHHCTSHQHHNAKAALPPNSAQRLFLQIVYAILALNFVGTAYDVLTGDDGKKSGILTAWSIRANWRRLTYDGGASPASELDTIHGIRVVASLVVLFAHACTFYYQYYVVNPQFLEHFFHRPDGVLISNGTSLVQVFTMITSFLTAYSLLNYSQTHKLNLTMLPHLILKRISRITPVHLLFIGFAATWWPRVFTGPFQWKAEDKSIICRRKFWSYAFFYNNIVDKHDQCLVPSWYLPVDMHLYIVACIFMIVMQQRRAQARYISGVLFIVSSLAGGVVSCVTGWQAMIYYSVPENTRGFFSDVESFGELYTSSWGSLPACFLGLYMAYFYYDLKDAKYNFNDNKLLRAVQHLILPVVMMWLIFLGSTIRHHRHPLLIAAHVVLDRPSHLLLAFFFIILVFKLKGFWHDFFTWRGWRVPARLSFTVTLCHWLVMDLIVARPIVYHASIFDMNIDYTAMVVYAHLIAVPIYLLVESPVQRFLSQLI